MAALLVLLFKNVLRFKRCYIVCYLICIGVFMLYFSSFEKNKSVAIHAKSPHTLCLIVPFRDRFEELREFIPHMSKFLNDQFVNFHINIINQVDRFRFNRGSLINAGFQLVLKKYPECDYMAMHDVDLLPLNKEISYAYPDNVAYHVSSPELHPRYHYSKFIGGILLMSNWQFERVNGLSNKYWGWGLEDDEFYIRLKEKSIEIKRPKLVTSNSTNTFRHIHGPARKRDFQRCFNQRNESRIRDRKTGLHDVNYVLNSLQLLTIDEFPFSLFNVTLKCDRKFTPWCICPGKKPQINRKNVHVARV